MILSTQTLPEGYFQKYEINLAKDKRLAILLNVLGFIIFVLTFVLLVFFIRWMRPGTLTSGYSLKVNFSTLWELLVLILLVAFNLAFHELIHGFFFWVFTRSKPVYALHLAYAYAAAPDWYIPVRQYWIIGLAPLVIIDAMGLLLILAAPLSWLLIIVFLVTLNTGGAVGDLFIISQLLRVTPDCIVRDTGDGVCFFEPRQPSSNHGREL
jgi:hypothetical protein